MKPHHSRNSRPAAALWRRRALQVLSGAVLAAAMPLAQATTYTLQDLNSTLTVDPSSSAGILSWTVDGVNQLNQQWFWGREGSSGPEESLNTLNLIGAIVSDTDFTGNSDTLALLYGDATTKPDSLFTVTLKLSLVGQSFGSKTSDLFTVGKITNKAGSSSINYHAFQYSDFNLSNNPGNDTVVTTDNGKTFVQSDGGMILTDGLAIGVTPPDHWQVATSPTILNSLNNTNPTTLSDSSSGGPDNMAYAREWDSTLDPGKAFEISLDQHITVPNPGTVLLLGAGMLGLAGASRRNRRKNQSMDQD